MPGAGKTKLTANVRRRQRMYIAISLLFLAPAYYLLRAKGYRPPVFLWPTVLITVLLFGVWMIVEGENDWTFQSAPAFNLAVFLPGIAVLALSWMLPTRKGAPGLSYLRIHFVCPHCNKVIKFGREREGLAELCPICGEIVTVPTGVQPQPPPIPKSLQKSE